MRFMAMVSAFVIALVGATAVGLRPGYPFGTLLLGATILAAMTGMAASVLQFLPQRYFFSATIAGGIALGLLVATLLRAARVLDFGDVHGATIVVWPVAAVVALFLGRASGMQMAKLRRRRTNLDHPRVG